jgi:hypothetical protein
VYKDIARWLMALVPVTTVGASVIAVAPHLDQARSLGLSTWLDENTPAAIWLAAVAVAVVAVVAAATYVLLAKPEPLADLQGDPVMLSKAFGEDGVGVPTFSTSDEFVRVRAQLGTDLAANAAIKELEATIGAVERTVTQLQTWSELRNARARFKQFAWVYGVGVVTIFIGVVAVALLLKPLPARITQPVAVSVRLSPTSETDFRETTHCADSASTTFFAVGGDWEKPALVGFGDGCTNAQWQPSVPDAAIVTPSG